MPKKNKSLKKKDNKSNNSFSKKLEKQPTTQIIDIISNVLVHSLSDSNKYTADEVEFVNKQYLDMCPGYSYTPAIISAKKEVIVFGDIHGDYGLALDMFLKANLIRMENDRPIWTGKSTIVIQVGDQVDRCRPLPGQNCADPEVTQNDEGSDVRILKFFTNLDKQARIKGGAVISLLGNHEILNVQGYMNYVSHEGLKEFENYKDPFDPDRIFESGSEARVHAFSPGNEYGKLLGCTRLPAVIIGSNIFVHAGIVDGLIKEINLTELGDFEKINIKMRKWLLGLLDESYVSNIIKRSPTSMFWTRFLGQIPPGETMSNPKCSNNLSKVLKLFKVGGIIIGHTPQSFTYSEDINSTCDNKIWRVDNGSSAAFNHHDIEFRTTGVKSSARRTQWLKIVDDNNYFVCDEHGCKDKIY